MLEISKSGFAGYTVAIRAPVGAYNTAINITTGGEDLVLDAGKVNMKFWLPFSSYWVCLETLNKTLH